MTTNRSARSMRRLLAGALLITFTLAACGAAAAPSASPAAPTPGAPGATPQPTPTAVPGDGGSGGAGGVIDPGTGGGSGSDPGKGGGILFPIPPGPNVDPMLGEAKYVTPSAGLVNQRTVNVQLVRAIVDAQRRATADLRWYSGVAPCNQLDSVQIQRDDAAKTIRLKVIEGSGPGDIACIDLAELHAAAVDLGVLASGTWTISAEGDAPAIKLDVP